MLIDNGTARFNADSGSGPRTEREEVIFASPVSQATAIVRGFDVAFSPPKDHHFGQLEVRVDATIDSLAPERVWVDVTYGLRDWSDEWNDKYEGEIHFTVVAE